jgi:transposase
MRTKQYRPYHPHQLLLLPPSLQEWLPEGHLAYFISDLVDSFPLHAIEEEYEDELRGAPPYDPVMMVKVLLYAYCKGVYSSRKIAQRLHEDVAFRVLAAGNTPDFRTLSEFRRRHLQALSQLFYEVLRLAREAGLVKLGYVALDGTKIRANASKHKAMSYGRMTQEEARLAEEVRMLLERAERVDAAEDVRYGPDRSGDELPEELRRRESRLKRIREAKAALEAQARRKGPWEEAEEVKAAILEAGQEFGLKRAGHRAYNISTVGSGWEPLPLRAIFTGEKMRPYREWLPANSCEARGSLGGSFVSENIEDYYLNPWDSEYGHLVKCDHDFIGWEALESMSKNPRRTKVTLVWNSEDVVKYTRQNSDPERCGKFIGGRPVCFSGGSSFWTWGVSISRSRMLYGHRPCRGYGRGLGGTLQEVPERD